MPRDPRTYIVVVDSTPEHPKVEPLSDAAFRLMVETWCWCSRYETDGRVRAAVWARRGTPKARRELVAAGLVEEVDGGVVMHDYLEHQRSAEEIRERRAVRAEAGRKGGLARSRRQASATASAQATGKQTASKVEPETETEEERVTTSPSPPTTSGPPTARGTRLPEPFEVTPDLAAWARTEAPHAGATDHAAFCDYWRSVPGAKGRKADWPATWRNWMRRASDEHDRPRRAGPATGPSPMDRAQQVADLGARMQARADAQQQALEAP